MSLFFVLWKFGNLEIWKEEYFSQYGVLRTGDDKGRHVGIGGNAVSVPTWIFS